MIQIELSARRSGEFEANDWVALAQRCIAQYHQMLLDWMLWINWINWIN